MKHTIALIALVITSSFAIYAQRIEQDITLAKNLLQKYEDADFAILEHKKTIIFHMPSRRKNPDGISVEVKNIYKIISLNSNTTFVKPEHYDDNSQISGIRASSKYNKFIKHGYYDKNMESGSIFHSDVRMKLIGFDFESKGQIQSLEYTKFYNDVKYFCDSYFHTEYPTVKGNIEIKIPEELNVDIVDMNFEEFNISKSNSVEKGNKEYNYEIKNISSSINEHKSPGISHFLPHLLFLSKSYVHKGNKQLLFNSLDDVYKWYKSLVDESEKETEKKEIISFTNELIKDKKTDIEKIETIYYWLQENIRYIAFEDGIAGYKPETAHKVFQNRYGDCKGMAHLAKVMLETAGFDARFSWLGTRRIAYDYSYPTLAADNHVICTLIHKDTCWFIDVTEKYMPLGKNAYRIQGRPVLIDDNGKYFIKKVPISHYSENLKKTNQKFIIENNIIKGMVTMDLLGENKTHFLYQYNTLKTDKKDRALTNYLENNNKNLIVSNITTSDLNDRTGSLKISHDIEKKNMINSFGSDLYIDYDHDKEFSGYEIDTSRVSNFVFDKKINIKSTSEFKIPSGFKTKHLPENLSIENDVFTIKVSFEEKEDKIIFNKEFIIPNAQITKAKFKTWNNTIKKLKSLYNDQIVLTKI